FGSGAIKQCQATQRQIGRVRIGRPLLFNVAGCSLHEFDVERPPETSSDLALRLDQVCAMIVEPVSPEMGAGFGIDELNVDLNLIAVPSHAAFDDIANAEFPSDLL